MRLAIAAVLTLSGAIVPDMILGQAKVEEPLSAISISGRVIDPAGAGVANASVKLKVGGSAEATATTQADQDGKYSFSRIAPGTYDLYFERSGFKPASLRDMRTISGKDATPSNVVMAWFPFIDYSSPTVPYHEAEISQTLNVREDKVFYDGPAQLGYPTPILRGKASLCDIVKNPERYSGKIVTVRGHVLIAFEDFELSAAKCGGRKIDGVWLEYGRGPAKQPTTWCCGDIIPHDVLRAVQNEEFREFDRYLTAQRRTTGCYEGHCYLYNVTATLTGRLDARRTAPCRDGKALCCNDGGFGHFGLFCSRLVIESVSNVVAKPIDPSEHMSKAIP